MDGQSHRKSHNAPRPAVVKSAVRALEILAYIDRCRAPVTVSGVADALGFPQSSTSALLRSLQATGYLHYEPDRRSYGATERVALLGSWVSAGLVEDGPVLRMSAALAERYGCAASLWTRRGNVAECLHLSDPAHVACTRVRVAAEFSLSASAPGLVFLSQLDDGHVRRLMHRLNAEADDGRVVRLTELQARLDRIRQGGLAQSTVCGASMVAALLPSDPARAPLVLALSGAASRIEQAIPAVLHAVGQGSKIVSVPPAWLQPHAVGRQESQHVLF